jgi:hypothetical protein
MEQAIKNMETTNAVNGVNVDELFGTIDAVKKAPVIAKFKFRAENEWIDGGHNRTIRNRLCWMQTNRLCYWVKTSVPIRWSMPSPPWPHA